MKANAIQLLSSLALSASLLFIPNLAKDLGASNTEVGIIGARIEDRKIAWEPE